MTCVRVSGCVEERRPQCPGNEGERLDPLVVHSVSPTYMKVHDMAHVCCVCVGATEAV
jgi:hypothetical protein